MMVVDLCCCGLRAVAVLLSVIGLVALTQEGPAGADPEVDALRATGPWEAVTGLGIVVFGVTADVAILLRQRWGTIVGWFAVAATFASMAVGVWQATKLEVPEGVDAEAFRIGAVIGVVVVSIVRLGLLAAYIGALLKFAEWSGPRAQSWHYS